jgi:hypothetical protein
MNRTLFLAAGFLVAIVVGVVIGYLAGRNNLMAGRIAENSTDQEPREASLDWQQWKYPGCSEHDSSLGGGGQMGKARVPSHYCLVMTTPDDYEQVLKFYADKKGFSDLAGSGSGTRASSNPDLFESWFVLSDSLAPDGVNQSRPVKAKLFGKRTPTYDLTMLVSRAKDEKHTHIVLSYNPAR